MNYFEHHIGDYAAATAHLTLIEDAIYSRLLRRYYLDECPLPADSGQCARIAGARTPDEREAAEAVLSEFFPIAEDGMRHNKRADEEIERYRHKIDTASANGKLGGRPKKAAGSENKTKPKAHQTPDTNKEQDQKQVTYGHSSPAPASPTPDDLPNLSDDPEKPPTAPLDVGMPACPHEAIIAEYHAALPTLPRIREWTAQRAALLRSRWRERPERQSLDWWRDFFAYVSQSDFLTGRTSRGNGHGGWECSLPWLLKAENFAKVIEGHYENREAAA